MIRLLIGYHGKNYHGWQIQGQVPTVEEAITKAVEKMMGQRVKVRGSSRTDAGVHANGQVACFDEVVYRSLEAWYGGLNRWTPDDITIHAVDRVPDSFHPRHDSRGKVYTYRISTAPLRDPMTDDRAWQLKRPLDIDAMRKGAGYLIGEQDFSSFRAVGCDANSPVRIIRRVLIEQESPYIIKITIEGSAFLKYMVRNIVGTLMWVGTGARPPEWVGEAIAARDRQAAGQTAPPQGLTLERIFYPHEPWREFVGTILER